MTAPRPRRSRSRSRRSRRGPSSGRLVAWLATVAGVVAVLVYPTTMGGPAPNGPVAASSSAADIAARSGRLAHPGTFRGDVVETAAGPVQVEITIEAGGITAVRAVQLPDGHAGGGAIDAGPVASPDRDAVQARTSGADASSGASVTVGYVASLQSAIDKAFPRSPQR